MHNAPDRPTGEPWFQISLLFSALLLLSPPSAPAAVLPPEKLLPNDSLVMVTVPDCTNGAAIFNRLPQSQLWSDPAMKAFRDKFANKFKEEIVMPLERDLGVRFADYSGLPQGQFTLALTQNGWQGDEDQSPALLLLLDTKDKSGQLKTNLAELKKKWVDAGKQIKTEKIRDIEFSVLLVSSNDIPKTLRRFVSPPVVFPDGTTPPATDKKPEPKSELYVGQAESLLIAGNSAKPIEKILVRLAGGPVSTLGEVPAYEAAHQAMFRDAPGYGWVNVKALVDVLTRSKGDSAQPDAPPRSPLEIRPDKVIAATGLSALKSVAWSFRDSNEGARFDIFLDVPEANRTGLFKILAGEAKEANPPPFVPADAVKFQRWRVDGQKAWATLEKMFNDISPQIFSAFNFLLESAAAAAKEKDPSFDLKKSLIESLGDDVVSYEKGARAGSQANAGAASSLFLIGSPRAEQLASALKQLLILLPQQPGDTPAEREFLGRKVYSTPLPANPGAGGAKPPPRSLHYSASGGYLAISTDVALLEEYLRSSESQGKSLRDTPGLTEAAQKVGGPGTSMFVFENQNESMRAVFEALVKGSGSASDLAGLPELPGLNLGMSRNDPKFRDWVDVSLLPAYDKIAKYFHFSVYGMGATVNGITLKVFMPVPPQLRQAPSNR